MHDVIVVGARCAGSPLAMLLASQGLKVLLVDRASFPSDVPHGHFIHRHGPRRLRDWGVLGNVAERTPAITNMLFDAGDFPLVARNLVEDGLAWGYGPRRTTFDSIMFDAAAESGADARQAFSVFEYIIEHGTVVGIHGRTQSGSDRARARTSRRRRRRPELRSRARRRAPRCTTRFPALLCYYFSYWSGVTSEEFELYIRTVQRRVIFSFKTEGDLFAVFVGAPMEEFESFRRDIEQAFHAITRSRSRTSLHVCAPDDAKSASTAVPICRTSIASRTAAAGRSSATRVSTRTRTSPSASATASETWSSWRTRFGKDWAGTRPLSEALADFEKKRNDASAADYQENIAAARFAPFPPQFFAVRAAVRDRPEEATRLVKARMRMIDPSCSSIRRTCSTYSRRDVATCRARIDQKDQVQPEGAIHSNDPHGRSTGSQRSMGPTRIGDSRPLRPRRWGDLIRRLAR